MLELLALPLAVVGYYFLVAFFDRSENADGSYGLWPFRKKAASR